MEFVRRNGKRRRKPLSNRDRHYEAAVAHDRAAAICDDAGDDAQFEDAAIRATAEAYQLSDGVNLVGATRWDAQAHARHLRWSELARVHEAAARTHRVIAATLLADSKKTAIKNEPQYLVHSCGRWVGPMTLGEMQAWEDDSIEDTNGDEVFKLVRVDPAGNEIKEDDDAK